jgi:CheY-like chemotaxis protein
MNVLIVDDEPLVRRSLDKVFKSKGHSVVLAENGRLGLEKWMAETFDLVLLDIMMPELTGPEVLNEIGSKRTGVVVLMSAYSGSSFEDVSKRFEIDLFVSKPFDEIFKIVDNLEQLCLQKQEQKK